MMKENIHDTAIKKDKKKIISVAARINCQKGRCRFIVCSSCISLTKDIFIRIIIIK